MVAAYQGDEPDLIAGQLEVGDRGPSLGQGVLDGYLGGEGRGLYRVAHAGFTLARGQDAPGETDEDQATDGQHEADGGEVEHLERLAQSLLTHLTDDYVG